MIAPRALSALLLLAVALPPSPGRAGGEPPFRRLELLGEVTLDPRCAAPEAPLGGLSALAWDPGSGTFLALSDDPSRLAPARLFRLRVDLADGRLDPGDVQVLEALTLRRPDGRPFAEFTIDAEGLALEAGGGMFIASEGLVARGVPPFLARFGADGVMIDEVELPSHFLPAPGGSRGVRDNLALESLALTPDGATLYAATENALHQDGEAADLARGSPVRILEIDAPTGRPRAEYLYEVEPVARPPAVEGGFRVNGLSELVALERGRLLALERSYSLGVGNTVRLFAVELEGATDIGARPALTAGDGDPPRPARKRLLLDLAELGPPIDNLEGAAFGPRLEDGRRTLILVSDDNFNPGQQVTQLLALAVGDGPVDLPRIQGAGHRSPLEGEWLWGVTGVVTRAERAADGALLWVQDPRGDGDPHTSDAITVEWAGGGPDLAPGDRVEIDGRVVERPAGGLTRTTLRAARVARIEGPVALPDPVEIGRRGRRPPAEVVDDDGLTLFEPESDGIDFFESLEGMRVTVAEPLVVGPTIGRQIVAVADRGRGSGAATSGGGLLLRPGDANPERLVLEVGGPGDAPAAAVGDRLGALRGVVTYREGGYLLLLEEPPRVLPGGRSSGESRRAGRRRNRLTVATYNVQNLHLGSPRMASVAATIAGALGAPALVALQEIQDDSGAADDGTVAAAGTLGELTTAIAKAGGPAYRPIQIDPEDGRDGGRPGGNIRVALLYDPERLRLVERGVPSARAATGVERTAGGAGLTLSPGRVAPLDPAFAGGGAGGDAPGRKPLAAEFRWRGGTLLVVNCHLKSKRGDDPLFGARQPPLAPTGGQRLRQAGAIRALIDRLLEADPGAAILVLGDFNDTEFAAPLRRLAADPLVNLTESLPEGDRYSFVYRGNAQLLDHVLLSRGLLEATEARVDIVHRNADRPAALRESDHDPVVLELRLRRRARSRSRR